MPLSEALAPLNALFMIVSFILGTLVGSFANVCVSRWPSGESVVSPRSRCPKCRNGIAWYDNIPILSWLLLGAKCRHCKLPIGWQYPLVEAITGVLFFLVYLRFGLVLAAPVYMAVCAALVIVTFQDLADWTIPNEITFPGIPAGLALSLVGMIYPESALRVVDPIDALIGIALGGGILYGLDRITVLVLKKPGMGFGDVKLLAMLGGFLGWQGTLGTLVIASLVGSVVGVGTILYFSFRGDAKKTPAPDSPEDSVSPEAGAETVVERASGGGGHDEEDDGVNLAGHYLPFGPYLALGGLIYLFYGPELVSAYLAFLQGT